MARGIITTKPTGGSTGATVAGRIIVTDTKSVDSGGLGSSAGVGTTLSASYELGSEVQFLKDTAANVGDLVDFSTDSTGQVYVNSVVTAGKVINGSSDGVVISGSTPVLITGTIDGKVTVSGGIAIISSAQLNSKLESSTANSYVLAVDSTISGKVELTEASYLSLKNVTVEGKVSSDGSLYTTIRKCSIEGSLDVINTSECHCSDNNVDGKTNTPNNQP
jgi:cytoskeletal protein CcmA (bactofilin family)